MVKLEEKFREEEELGRMYPTTIGVLQSLFPDRPVLVAAMGAIPKSDGSVRPVHDATHFVQVNNKILIEDQLQYPGPHCIAGVLREVADTKEAVFTISADIKAAHRLVKIRKCDWSLLCCKADSDSKVIWVNTCGTFGVSSAPCWWSRLFACAGRLASRILGQEWVLQLAYVDDLRLVGISSRKFANLWIMILAYEVWGHHLRIENSVVVWKFSS